jgi:hypothetical protein
VLQKEQGFEPESFSGSVVLVSYLIHNVIKALHVLLTNSLYNASKTHTQSAVTVEPARTNHPEPSSSSSIAVVKHAMDCECDSCTYFPATQAEVLREPVSLRQLLRTAMHGNKGKFNGLKPIRIRLMSTQFNQSSATPGTNSVNNSITLTTGNFPELASFLSVYDEMRVLKGAIHWYTSVSGTGANSGIAFNATSCLFDQTAGNPTSVNGVLEETFSQGPFALASVSSNFALNSTKMHRLDFHPPTSTAPIGTNVNPGRSWFILDSTNAPHIVQVNHFCTNPTGTATTVFAYYVELDVEMRMRT